MEASWVIIDAETTGSVPPIYVVDLAAQRMRGWEPDGPPFRMMLNHGVAIPPEVSRVNGYTREILERDGDEPRAVYAAFSEYVGDRSVAAYNLAYDWDSVLVPAWERLGLAPAGSRGLCLLQLAQRLLDPVPAGNCKLQTLRQYYRLPERGAHTALGDVETTVDLVRQVLRSLAEQRGLNDWNALLAFAGATWFPSRIPFGKFKGRRFRDAKTDHALHGWLEWLAASTNGRSAQMGQWYLARLETGEPAMAAAVDADDFGPGGGTGLVVFRNLDHEHLKVLVESARARLAELEAEYTSERQSVQATQAKLFWLLRPLSQRRDLLKLQVEFRRKYLDALMSVGEEEAEAFEAELENATRQVNEDYEQAAAASADRRPLTDEEAVEVKQIFRRLVKIYHPDRFTGDPDRQSTYERLTAAINRARDDGDLDALREIAADPEGFILRQGWSSISLDDSGETDRLQELYASLQGEILGVLESLNALRQSSEHELHERVRNDPNAFERAIAAHSRVLEKEIAELDVALERLDDEVAILEDRLNPC